jgi:glycosyltransferase involved in cell wall biosynthesis
MRILWISDSPDTPSGFGNVTRFVCEGLARRGHNVSIIGWQSKQEQDWHGCKVFPASGMLGSRSLFPFLVRYRPEIVIALGDVWWLPYFTAPHVRRQMQLTDTPWALYFPIDGDLEGGKLPQSWIQMLTEVDIPIAMSQFGRDAAVGSGVKCRYIPHGVDRGFFYPPADREQAKAEVDAQGRFLVLSDSRNQPRKMLPRLLDVFAKFAAGRPDALLHLHTDPEDEFTRSGIYSYNVRADLKHLGIESQVRFTPGMKLQKGGGVPLEQLSKYYRAADVHLLASSGEGFGLPTLQAAAAGAVPMASDYSASRELVTGHGEAIDIAEWSENEFGIRRALINIDDAVRKLTMFYDDRALLAERSQRSAQFAQPYDWGNVLDQWDELLRSTASSNRRMSRVPATQTLPESLVSKYLPGVPAGTVKVNVVEHKFGRLEAGIIADTKGHLSDGRIPAIQKACEVGGVRVVRSPAYVGVGPGDEGTFQELRSLFPILCGWVPILGGAGAESSEGLNYVSLDRWEEARYDLAQSVLLLNVHGGLSDAILLDSALYGVPCIGWQKSEAQQILWPELATDNDADAVRLARSLLTNSATLRSLSARGRVTCQTQYALSEEDAAAWLRRLHTAKSPYAVTGAR